jgi:hypothetical protein
MLCSGSVLAADILGIPFFPNGVHSFGSANSTGCNKARFNDVRDNFGCQKNAKGTTAARSPRSPHLYISKIAVVFLCNPGLQARVLFFVRLEIAVFGFGFLFRDFFATFGNFASPQGWRVMCQAKTLD